MDQRRIFRFLTEQMNAGMRCALVTVLAVEGSAMRNPGSHMAVCEDGSFIGSLSGGCIENAVVAEALEALKTGEARIVRFGSGSPYVDIRLPCGGGLDIHFHPMNDAQLASDCLVAIEVRHPYSVKIMPEGVSCVTGAHSVPFDRASGVASFGHFPQARVLLVGHGEVLSALATLAQSMGLDTSALTPDERAFDRLQTIGVPVTHLTRTTETELLQSDPWTAIAFLFHDHDWEIPLMQRAFALPNFYIGAMGGRRAHAARCEALLAADVPASAIARLHAPIGLFHSSRDPDTLALSALAQIVQAYQEADFGPAFG